MSLVIESSPLAAGFSPAAGKQPFDRKAVTYCYVIVRQDLSLEQQMVQAIHAAMAATADHGGLKNDTRLAVVAVKNQAQLLEWAGRLERQGIAFSLFQEPDHGIGSSALATAPGAYETFKALRRLPLWKSCPDLSLG